MIYRPPSFVQSTSSFLVHISVLLLRCTWSKSGHLDGVNSQKEVYARPIKVRVVSWFNIWHQLKHSYCFAVSERIQQLVFKECLSSINVWIVLGNSSHFTKSKKSGEDLITHEKAGDESLIIDWKKIIQTFIKPISRSLIVTHYQIDEMVVFNGSHISQHGHENVTYFKE